MKRFFCFYSEKKIEMNLNLTFLHLINDIGKMQQLKITPIASYSQFFSSNYLNLQSHQNLHFFQTFEKNLLSYKIYLTEAKRSKQNIENDQETLEINNDEDQEQRVQRKKKRTKTIVEDNTENENDTNINEETEEKNIITKKPKYEADNTDEISNNINNDKDETPPPKKRRSTRVNKERTKNSVISQNTEKTKAKKQKKILKEEGDDPIIPSNFVHSMIPALIGIGVIMLFIYTLLIQGKPNLPNGNSKSLIDGDNDPLLQGNDNNIDDFKDMEKLNSLKPLNPQ